MKQVIVYTGSFCAYCPQLKKYLEHKKVSYTEKSIDDDSIRQELVDKYHSFSVPTLVVGDKVVVGYHMSKIVPLIKTL